MTYVIGLTGGIASGKSTVTQYLRQLNIQVVDCDMLAHQSYDVLFDEIKALFPDAIVDGMVDRRALGAIVFHDVSKKAALEGLIHPYVKSEMEKAIASCKDKYIVLDIPLLYEAHMESLCNEIWVVYVPYDIQLERLVLRNNYGLEEAKNRILNQMSLEEKKARADYVLDNSSSLDALYKHIEKRLEELDERFITGCLSGL